MGFQLACVAFIPLCLVSACYDLVVIIPIGIVAVYKAGKGIEAKVEARRAKAQNSSNQG